MNNQLRLLPFLVRPRPDDTTDTFIQRLAEAVALVLETMPPSRLSRTAKGHPPHQLTIHRSAS
ncbi:hypothetical protein ACIBHX_52195 [Nonomuraea sp. NPDC050536]|uniref:hypothetical protein n=1 Tax=Nonomuraea sp. NPDC050536 TaxID=3364366 RepID=UPI0037C5D475